MRLVLVTMMMLALGCGASEDDEDVAPADSAQAPLRIHTVSYPLAYFAERIGGESAEVSFPAPAGSKPASWSPDATTIAAYQEADLILLDSQPFVGQTSGEPIDTHVSRALTEVFNVGVGVEHDFNEKVTAYGSFQPTSAAWTATPAPQCQWRTGTFITSRPVRR